MVQRFIIQRTTVIADRTNAINALLSRSIYRTQVDVTAQDQLLLFVTCVDDDDERRGVAARRICEDENEEMLQKLIRRTTKKPSPNSRLGVMLKAACFIGFSRKKRQRIPCVVLFL